MDDSSFERFVLIDVAQLLKHDTKIDITPQQLISGIHQMRDDPRAFMDYKDTDNGNITWRYTPTLCWFPGCFFMGVTILVLIVFVIFLIIIIPTTAPGCGGFAVDVHSMSELNRLSLK